MPAKKQIRPANFPLHIDDREGAQKRADEDYRGNLTAYINSVIRADVLKANRKNKKP